MLNNEEIEALIRMVYQRCGFTFLNREDLYNITSIPSRELEVWVENKSIDCLGNFPHVKVPLSNHYNFSKGIHLRTLIEDLCEVASQPSRFKTNNKSV